MLKKHEPKIKLNWVTHFKLNNIFRYNTWNIDAEFSKEQFKFKHSWNFSFLFLSFKCYSYSETLSSLKCFKQMIQLFLHFPRFYSQLCLDTADFICLHFLWMFHFFSVSLKIHFPFFLLWIFSSQNIYE